MSAFRDFDAARRERAAARQPLGFTLGGESFELVSTIPAGVVLDLVTGRGNMAAIYRQFLRGALRDDDGTDERASSLERWELACYRRDDPIDEDTVVEVVEWIAEAYTGRPTERSTGSPAGPPPDGLTSSGSSGVPESETPEESSST